MGELSAAFFVPGDPKPKGSIRIFKHGGHIPDSVDMREWCHRVTEAAKVAIDHRGLEEPVGVTLRFAIRRPKGHYGKNGTLRPTAPRHPAKKPDIDKLARAVLDALTSSGVWLDDSQVVRLECTKVYGAEPGVHVRLEAA